MPVRNLFSLQASKLDTNYLELFGIKVKYSFIAGVTICVVLAMFAILISKVSSIPMMLLALLCGIVTRACFPNSATLCESGITYCTKTVLRFGIALLGLRVVVGDLIDLGFQVALLIFLSLIVTVYLGYFIHRLLNLKKDISIIATTSVAICGASAALAASSVVESRKGLSKDTASIIVIVSLLSTLVMVVYPWLCQWLGMDHHVIAIMLGATIHDVAQVAGAGFSISNQVGVEAVTVKMIRVACLLPVIIVIGFNFARQHHSTETGKFKLVPPFLIVFFMLAVVASLHIIPSNLIQLGSQAAGWLLIVSVTGIGLKTTLKDLRSIKPALPAAIILVTSLQFFAVYLLTIFINI